MKQQTLQETFAKWDRGEAVFDDCAEALRQLEDGDSIADIFQESTICPVHNGTCSVALFVHIQGMKSHGQFVDEKIQICPLGIKKDCEGCILNK